MHKKPALSETILRVINDQDVLYLTSRRLIQALRDILHKCTTAGEMQHVARKALHHEEVKNGHKL